MDEPSGFYFCCPCLFWGKNDKNDKKADKHHDETKHKKDEVHEKQIEEGGVDPAAHGAQMEDRYHNNKTFQQPDVDPNDPQQQEAALQIQTKYRQFHAKKVVEEKRQEKAAVKIQAGYRGFQDRKAIKTLRDGETEEPEPSVDPEIDIDLDDPEVNAAAAKIQAGFRGHQARKEIEKQKQGAQNSEPDQNAPEGEIDLTDPELDKAAQKIQAGFRGYQTRREMKSQKESEQPTESEAQKEEGQIDVDPNDPEANNAAAKIQAGFRGMQARKELKGSDTQSNEVAEENTSEVDIDLEDPEVANAASKIQAGFRGMQDRKRVKELKEGNSESGETAGETEQAGDNAQEEEASSGINLEDPDVQLAATKIQASFRGYQTRKDISDRRKTGDGATEEGAPSNGSRQNYDDGFV